MKTYTVGLPSRAATKSNSSPALLPVIIFIFRGSSLLPAEGSGLGESLVRPSRTHLAPRKKDGSWFISHSPAFIYRLTDLLNLSLSRLPRQTRPRQFRRRKLR